MFCLCLVLSFSAAQVYDDCDNKRTEEDCKISPGVCFWNSSKLRIGHACIKFSGNCSDIITNVSTECTNAGNGMLCDWQTFGSGENAIARCVDKCNRLNQNNCTYGHDYCGGWNSTSGKCMYCSDIIGSTECGSSNCVWDNNVCKVGCRGLYSGTHDVYGSGGGPLDCVGNSSCYVNTVDTADRYGFCQNFPSSGCTGVGDSSPDGQTTCDYVGGGWNVKCRWDSSLVTPACVVAPTPVPSCETFKTQAACKDNQSCYWNSYSQICSYTSSCTSIRTYNPEDCTNAKEYIFEYKACTYKTGIGCVANCADYVSTDSNPAYYASTCNGRGDCWWDSTAIGSHYGGCKALNNCGDMNNSVSCNHTSKKSSCYWNTPTGICLPYTHCSDIGTNLSCGYVGGRCKWNLTACVDSCNIITNQYDCQDRPDCRWNNNYCQTQPNVLTVNCKYLGYTNCINSDRCIYHSETGSCLDKIVYPITDDKRRGCSTYNDSETCNADPGCVYNSGRSQCLNYTSCAVVTYSGFGGVFPEPQTDCNAKGGCMWKVGNDDPTCGTAIGECVDDIKVDCNKFGDGVSCNSAASDGCFWSSGGCIKGECGYFNSFWCGNNESCQWSSDYNYCLLKCSAFNESKCRENNNDCFWADSTCSVFYGEENCGNIKTYDHCMLKSECEWVSSDPVNVSVGSCFSRYEKINLIVRGCDDIQNEKQCNNYTYSFISCVYIWDANHNSGNCSNRDYLNCSWYKNQQQCTTTSNCYWNSGSNGGCQEYYRCENISVKDCETAKNCGIYPGGTSCTSYPCTSRLFGVCSGKCEWYKGACSDFDPNRRTTMANTNILRNSEPTVLGITISSISNPCSGLNPSDCNSNKTRCNLGCVYNTQNVSSSSGCILLQYGECSSIKYPLFQFPEIDCDARTPCYWNDGKCGETPPSSTEIIKLPHAVVGSFLVFLLCLFMF